MVVVVEMFFFLWVLQLFVVGKKEEERNMTSITNVSRREKVGGKNYELLMETRGL
jgi:hypothetical protein